MNNYFVILHYNAVQGRLQYNQWKKQSKISIAICSYLKTFTYIYIFYESFVLATNSDL